MYSYVLPFIAMYYSVLPCIGMYCHVLPCTAMYNHTWQYMVIHGSTWQLRREYFKESGLYGIYALVVDVSEIERVSAANE